MLINRFYNDYIQLDDRTFINNPDKLIKSALKRIYNGQLRPGQIDNDLFQHNHRTILKGMEKGWGNNFGSIKYNAPDWEFTQNLKYNAAVFSAFKNHHETAAISALLIDDKGRKRSYADFEAEALKVSEGYNKTHLKAEYNRAMREARAAKDWQRFQSQKHLYPNLKYIATKDERTRDSHMALDGAVYPIDHWFWDYYYIPIDWGCRCRVEQTDEAVNEVPGIEIKKDFANNAGKTGMIFTPEHPYIRDAKPEHRQKIKNFVESNVRRSEDVSKAMDKYKAYDHNWNPDHFDINTGGFVVRHIMHSTAKETLKRELKTAKVMANLGYTVELMAEPGGKKMYDAIIGLKKVEFKATQGLSNIKRYALQAAEKGAEVVLFHLSTDTNKNFYRYINEVLTKDKYKPIKEVWWIDQAGKLHKKTP